MAGTPNGKIDRHHQFAIANDHDQQESINAREHPMLLTAPPGAHQPELLTILVEDRVIDRPGPLPTTSGRVAFPFDMTPKRS
jgi:hypothetical protein